MSEPTYYKWKSQFSGMTVLHLSQLRQLQDENAKLKRTYADLPAARVIRALNEFVEVRVRRYRSGWTTVRSSSSMP